MLKSPGTLSRACVHGAFWRYHCLRAFSGADTGAPGIKSDWCIYSICAVYNCLAVWEPHQWWWGLYLRFVPGTVSSVPFPTGEEVTSKAWEVCSFISWDFFPASINMSSVLVPGHNKCPGNVTYVFCCNDGLDFRLVFTARLSIRIVRNASTVIARGDLSVCLSVRPSVTFRCFLQTNGDTIMQSSASGRTMILVSWEVNFIWIFAGYHPQVWFWYLHLYLMICVSHEIKGMHVLRVLW